MQEKTVIRVVGTQCAPELERQFNDWYNEIHIPMLLRSEWLEGVSRYRLSPETQGDYPGYLAIYEFKDQQAAEAWLAGPERQAAAEEMKETWGGRGFEMKWVAGYECIRAWHK